MSKTVKFAMGPPRYLQHFRWWNVFDVMCRMGCWSFWCWFDV